MTGELEVAAMGIAFVAFGALAYFVSTKYGRGAKDDGASWSVRFKLGVGRFWGAGCVLVGVACILGAIVNALS